MKKTQAPGGYFVNASSSFFTPPNKLESDINQSLQTINSLFLTNHEQVAVSLLQNIQYVFVYLNGVLVTFKNDGQGKFNELTSFSSAAHEESNYTFLKKLSHITILLVELLAPVLEKNIFIETLYPQFTLLLNELKLLEKANDKLILPYLDFLADSRSLIENVLQAENNLPAIEYLLQTYLKKVTPILELFSEKASVHQLDSIKGTFNHFLSQNMIDLKDTRLLIVGPHGPRKGLLEEQVFKGIYREHNISGSLKDNLIYYVEMLPKQISKINVLEDLIEGFLAGEELNKRIGKMVLGNEKGMSKDILGKYAEKILASEDTQHVCPFRQLK